jgi:hypothetical protein
MFAGQADLAAVSPLTRPSALDVAAARLYDAEVALHCAHQSKVDAWIAAANDRLHEAVEAHARAWRTSQLAS